MNQSFDFFGAPELPYLVLCNPSGEQLYSLGLAYDRNIILRFNALSEFSFVFPKSIDGGATNITAYDYIQNKRLVLVEGYGYFQITDVNEENDGSTPIKTVKCQSLESELIQKKVLAYSGTKKLYDAISPTGTVLQDMIALVPTWAVGTIDAELTTKYRTFDTPDTNVYGFLIENVSKAFDCVFIFDSTNKTISAKTIANATFVTDIFLSYNNVIEKSEFSEKSDEIVTSLGVYGGGDLTIRSVNPLGTNKIYDFSYYATSSWMSSGLVSSVLAWQALVTSKQSEYSSLLGTLRTYNSELIILEGERDDLQSELKVLDTTKSVMVQGGQDLGSINSEIAAKQAEIDAKEVLISNKQGQIDSVSSALISINDDVSFESNFSPTQLLELNNFIYENTYQNSNIIQTDSMDSVELQDAAQDLYDQAKIVLAKTSQPRYEISLDSVNYISLTEFSIFTSQTEPGCVVTVELKDGTYADVVLLELSFNFDNPTDFKMTFSNRLRLDGENYKYSDLMGQVVQAGTQVSFNSSAWSDWNSNYKDDVSTFISSSLDASLNSIISNSDQDVKIDQTGLRVRKSDGAGGFQNNQMWLTNGVLAFSDDKFTTAKLALGQITTPTGGTAFGLVGDYIVGRILAGNSLTITNEGANFVLDATGATLTNAKSTIQTTNTKIISDPTSSVPFRIQKNQGGTFVDKFSVNNSGDVTFSGVLSGASGSFSGTVSAGIGNIGTLVIDSNGLKTSDGSNYLRGSGDLKWGPLVITGSTGTFSGNFYASNMFGQVDDSQIANLSADKINAGTINGIDIYGSTISWPGTSMYSGGYGFSVIDSGRMEINANNGKTSSLLLDDGSVVISSGYNGSNGSIILQAAWGTLELNELYLYSNISGDGGYGYSDTIRIQTSSGYKYFVFDNGILTNVY